MNAADALITLVLADDEALLRSAMASLLPLKGPFEVVAQASDGAAAVEATLEHRPDVLVVDLEMPGMDGLEAVAAVRKELPAQRVLMITRHARPGVLRRALTLGVQGFVGKSADPEVIAQAIQALHAGGRWIDPEVSALAVLDDSPLTAREADVLRETRAGYAVDEIAKRLFLAEGTVWNYISTAKQKTQARSRHEAARYASERDWL